MTSAAGCSSTKVAGNGDTLTLPSLRHGQLLRIIALVFQFSLYYTETLGYEGVFGSDSSIRNYSISLK